MLYTCTDSRGDLTRFRAFPLSGGLLEFFVSRCSPDIPPSSILVRSICGPFVPESPVCSIQAQLQLLDYQLLLSQSFNHAETLLFSCRYYRVVSEDCKKQLHFPKSLLVTVSLSSYLDRPRNAEVILSCVPL